MKIGMVILNAMFLLLYISVVVAEWGNAPATVAGIAIFNIVLNAIFIIIKVPNDFISE